MTLSSSQSLTPPDAHLEKLMGDLIFAARAEGGFGRKWRLDDIDKATAALREYLSERTLTEDEAAKFLWLIDNSSGNEDADNLPLIRKLQRIDGERCPNCEVRAIRVERDGNECLSCPRCGEEWYTVEQSQAASNRRRASMKEHTPNG